MGHHTMFIQYGGHQYGKIRENRKQRLTSYPRTRLPLDANPYITLISSDKQRALRGQQPLNNIHHELYKEIT
jgi:hypothetical protein